MSRIDKYDPVDGGFRAPLNAALTASDVGKVYAVSINGSGRAVVGGGSVGALKGVICPTQAMAAGDVIDVMTDGEITDFDLNGSAAAAGTSYFIPIAGTTIGTTGTDFYVGHTVEATRLVVRVGR